MSFPRFFASFALVLILLFGGAVAINAAVDPYDLNVGPGRSAPPVKRETGSHGRLHKAYALIRLKPVAVALGASRTEAAIRMDHPGWAGTPAERYNAAVTAANLREIWAFLQLAAASGRLKQALIGLEFYSFNVYAPNRPDFEPALMNGEPTRILGVDPVRARYDLSFDTLLSSLRTATSQDTVPHFLLDGRVNPDALSESYRGRDGQLAAFLEADREALQLYYLPPPRHRFSLDDGHGEPSLALFRRMLDFARERRIDLRLYISPGHARSLEAVHLLGLEERYEQWQRDLVRVVAEEAAASGQPPFALWDFSAPSVVTDEPVPPDSPAGPRSRGYWESSHYRAEVGDLVLDRVFGTADATGPMPPGFGVLLEASGIGAHQAAARAARAEYRRTHVAELEALARWVR